MTASRLRTAVSRLERARPEAADAARQQRFERLRAEVFRIWADPDARAAMERATDEVAEAVRLGRAASIPQCYGIGVGW